MKDLDEKMWITNVIGTEQLFRLIQFIISPKAFPFKFWLGQVVAERLDKMQDPELPIDKTLVQYMQLGYSESKCLAKQGDNVAKVALKELEAKTGKKVVTGLNPKSVLWGLVGKFRKTNFC